MTTPKLLAQITVGSGVQIVASDSGGLVTCAITATTHGSVLEVLDDVATQLTAGLSGTFTAACSAAGIVTLTSDAAWNIIWSTTTDSLSTMLGYAETESVSAQVLTATLQHRYGFYPHVGARYPIDPRSYALKSQDTAAGGVSNNKGTAQHRYRDIEFQLLSPESVSEGGVEGGTTWTNVTLRDFWEYALVLPWRFYADSSDGTVADPGAEGTEYDTLRFYKMPRFEARNDADPDSWAYWTVTLTTKVCNS